MDRCRSVISRRGNRRVKPTQAQAASFAASGFQHVDIGYGYQVALLLDAQPREHVVRFFLAAGFVVLREQHFEFDEIAETVHAIQMDARAPDQINMPFTRCYASSACMASGFVTGLRV